MVKISLIAAHGKNLEIGKNNQLLWNLPNDLKRFRELTKGHVVIMGSKTFESIGRPLPNRINIIITNDKNFKAKGCIVANSIDDAIKKGKELESSEIFIIGGSSIYKQFLPLADKLYITLIDKEFPGADTFFPKYDDVFKNITLQEEHEYEGLKYTFLEIEK